MSELDIEAGERSLNAIARALKQSQVAVAVLTRQNLNAPWVLFEAGALSLVFSKGAVIPFLVDVNVSALPGPLSQFQARVADRDGTLDLVRRINSLSAGEPDRVVADRFKKQWATLGPLLRRLRVHDSVLQVFGATHVQNAQMLEFTDATAYDLYIAERINSARREVCDLTWKDTIGPTHDLRPRRRSLREYEISIARASERIAYREIFVFNDLRRIEKLKRRLAEDRPGYSCRYFELGAAEIPRVQFVLFDESEIAFGSHGSARMGVVVRSQELGQIMKAYFEDIWRRATPIKDGSVLHKPTVDKILRDATARKGRLTLV